MNSLLRGGDAWVFPPAPPERLATLRILTGLFAVIYLTMRLRAFVVLADAGAASFEPVKVLSFLDEPLAGPVVVGLVFVALGFGLAYTLGATYVLASVAKLRLGGTDWIFSDALRNHVAYSAVRVDLLGGPASPFGRRLVAFAWLFPPMAVGAVILELASPLALFGGRVRTVWVAWAWFMHVAIAALMYVTFPYPLFLVAFAPFYRLERLTETMTRALTRRRNLIRTRR